MTRCVMGGMESGEQRMESGRPESRESEDSRARPEARLTRVSGWAGRLDRLDSGTYIRSSPCSDKVGGLIETLGKKFGQAEYQPFRIIELSSAAYPPRGVL